MYKIIILLLVILHNPVYAAKYGRNDRTDSPAYHGRYNKTFHYQSTRQYLGYNKPTVLYERTPSYTPRNYHGYPYGQYRGYGKPQITNYKHKVFGIKFFKQGITQ